MAEEQDGSGLLTSRGINSAFHYVPLHYLLFIARSGALYSKLELRQRGHSDTHFRRTSRDHDVARGFGHYVHLSLKRTPPILNAKLAAGFPHFEIEIPAATIQEQEFHLCRFNIAKCRYLRRGGATGPAESLRNGRYYGAMQLPIAVTRAERASLLEANFPATMVEVLIPNAFSLPVNASFVFFSQREFEIASGLLEAMPSQWLPRMEPAPRYYANHRYFADVVRFLDRSSRDPLWMGDGLEFDSV